MSYEKNCDEIHRLLKEIIDKDLLPMIAKLLHKRAGQYADYIAEVLEKNKSAGSLTGKARNEPKRFG